MTDHVVQFSGGVSSWATARIVKDDIMADGDTMTLLFADTLIEDEDTYRFLDAAAADIDVPLIRLADGRTIWQIFKDVRFLGNSHVDPCSRILKRELLRAYIDEHFDPTNTIIYLGLDWTEIHRLEEARPRFEPWTIAAPLTETALSKTDLLRWADKKHLPRQRLYMMGLPHANCGGGCVKAGHGQFIKLLAAFPERYAEWETHEEEIRSYLGKDVAILRDRTGDTTRPMTLRELRERHSAGEQLDIWDFGGCACW